MSEASARGPASGGWRASPLSPFAAPHPGNRNDHRPASSARSGPSDARWERGGGTASGSATSSELAPTDRWGGMGRSGASAHAEPGGDSRAPAKWSETPPSARFDRAHSNNHGGNRFSASVPRTDRSRADGEAPSDSWAQRGGVHDRNLTAFSNPATFERMRPPDLEDRPLPPRDYGLTRPEMDNWMGHAAERSKAAPAPRMPREAETEPSQAYPVIYGRDSKGMSKLLVTRKTVINAFTTNSGEHVAQNPVTEMRGAGQYALPGGKARNDASLATSAADEALAETGVNVRNASFRVTDVVRNDSGGQLRSHTFFQYSGDIDQLAARANAVLHAGRTADNEVESVHAMTREAAIKSMGESHAYASSQAGQARLNKWEGKRLIGDGQDWHVTALESPAAQQALAQEPQRAEPTPAAASAAPPPRPRSGSVLAMPSAYSARPSERAHSEAASSRTAPATSTTPTAPSRHGPGGPGEQQ